MTEVQPSEHFFDRTGLAALSDLHNEQYKRLFDALEKDQAAFLAKQKLFSSPEYIWPKDALHNWSRIWEYPYVHYHLARWRASLPSQATPMVVDVGSGVTFFPFSIARLGCNVIGTDNDPVCGRDLVEATKHISASPGSVGFRLTDGSRLPFADGECDAVYCISVLEHIPQFATTIADMARVLKPQGLLVLTIDLDLRGNLAIRPEPYRQLIAALQEHFDLVCPDMTIHPADMLESSNSPYPLGHLSTAPMLIHLFRQMIKTAIGQHPKMWYNLHLAVEGFVLQKKGG